MRTKSLCLAAAAFVGGLLTASAQSNVYSLNVVGYVNTVFKGGGSFTMVANPLDAPTNDAVNLLPLNSLPNGSRILTWNGAGYDLMAKTLGTWTPSNVALPVGKGFFLRNTSPSDITNTFVGNVLGGMPGTNTTQVVPGFELYGSKAPIGGDLFANGDNTLNMGALLNSLPNGSRILTWNNSGAGSFNLAAKTLGTWTPSNVVVNVGEGFFVRNTGATTNTWTVVLTNAP